MRFSLAGVLLVGVLVIVGAGFTMALLRNGDVLESYAQERRQSYAADRLAQLDRSASLWMERQQTLVSDLGTHSILIQGVMQPEESLREMRRYLDHTKWEGKPVQLSVFDFEGAPVYQRFAEPEVALSRVTGALGLLEDGSQSIVRAHTAGRADFGHVAVLVRRDFHAERLRNRDLKRPFSIRARLSRRRFVTVWAMPATVECGQPALCVCGVLLLEVFE